ncbi:MAG: ABC transporter ATP-binding protein [Tissierellia bacterium]|nr:ABC transporter ATP-binding protein [Tissierellia bacterium]
MNIIETINLTKYFGDFCANKNISLQVIKGEVLSIVGENGAGKTTLMNMLYGLIQPSSGQILINGQEVNFKSPSDAIDYGLGMVHQHFKLVPSLKVYENILLGKEIKKNKRSPFISVKEERKQIQELVDKYQFELDIDARIQDISVGERQRVEILKMLYRDVDILILDEPTAVLTPQEATALIGTMKKLKDMGKTLIIITHKLQEVMDVSDQVVVIRRGEVIGSVRTADTDIVKLAQMMVGRDVELSVTNDRTRAPGNVMYEVSDLTMANHYGKEVVSDISFSIHKGEILGIAGVEGNGQSELIKLLTGLYVPDKGSIKLNGEDITTAWPKQLRHKGVGIIPEDRYAEGLCKTMTITENCICGYHYEADVCNHGFIKLRESNKKRDCLIEQYDIRVADPAGTIAQLSGGNAQKVIIGRELDRNPKFIIASQPTRGVDIGSIEFIHNQLLKKKNEDVAVLLISSDLNEVMTLSDRILVMYKGKIVGELSANEFDRELIGLFMAGVTLEQIKQGEAS